MSAVLGSWKEIANYLGKGVRTVQRWERELGLPVRRPAEGNKGVVMAFPAELENWMRRQVSTALAHNPDNRLIQLQSHRTSRASVVLFQQTVRLMALTETLHGRCKILIEAQERRKSRNAERTETTAHSPLAAESRNTKLLIAPPPAI